MTYLDHLRFRLAFSRSRREALRNAALILAIVIGYGIAGRMDYEDQLRHEAQAAQAKSDYHQAALLACLNGGAPGLYTMTANGKRAYVVCHDPYVVTDENTRSNKS